MRQTELSEAAIVTIIRTRIQEGHYPEGVRLPSESALAAELGVTRWFVRQAYNRLTADGVIERKDFRRPVVPIHAGFVFTSSQASSAPNNRRIAALLPSHPVCAGGLAIVAGITRALKDLGPGHHAEILDNSFQSSRAAMLESERIALETISASEELDGLIWWCCGDDQIVADFRQARPDLPIVFIDRLPGVSSVDFVGIDDVDTAQAAVFYLIKLGHNRIAHVMDAGEYSTVTDRALGYRTALNAAGFEVDEDLIVQLDWERGNSRRALDKLWGLRDRPTAIFAGNDFIAYSLIDETEAKNIAVPEELSIVGHGNLDQFGPRKYLSTVDQPYERIGRKAARLLISRVAIPRHPAPPAQHIILEAPLIARKSCCPPPPDRRAGHDLGRAPTAAGSPEVR